MALSAVKEFFMLTPPLKSFRLPSTTCLPFSRGFTNGYRGVIDAANAALQEHLEREHPALAEKCVIPDLMKEIWKKRVR